MKRKDFIFWLFLILLIAAILRFYKLGSLLPLFGDEVDMGYNAYSILKTGRDVTGHFLPIYLKTIIDTKSSLLAWLTTVPVFFFGLNDLSIRLIPALSGIMIVFLSFLLVRRLSGNMVFALISAFLVAVTPWAIHFSRGAFEANLMLALILGGIYLFLISFKQKKWLYLSALVFGLSFYAYHSAKVLVPLVLFGLCFFFKQNLKKISQKNLMMALVIFLVVSLPMLYASFFSGGQQRFKEVSLFSSKEIIDQIIVKRNADENFHFLLPSRFFHNKGEAYFQALISNYLTSFSPQFLFLNGDLNFRHSCGELGEFYLLFLPFFLIGLFYFFEQRQNYQQFLLYLMFISPFPAIVTKDGSQHAIRLLFLMPIVLMVTAFGVTQFYLWLKKNLKQKAPRLIICFVLILLFLFNFASFAHQYFWHYPKESWRYWAYGYKEIMLELNKNQNSYQKVFLNNNYEPSILWFLFWTKYPPQKFQQEFNEFKNEESLVLGWSGFRLDKFYFGHLTDEYQKEGGILKFIKENKESLFLITQEKEVGGDWDWEKNPPQGIKVLKTVRNPYQQPIFYLVKND